MNNNNIQLFLIILFFNYTASLQCVDHNNNPVDWYVIYKLPLQKNENPLIAKGAAYTYMTSIDSNSWNLANHSINDTNSLVGVNLKPLFNNKRNKLYILYNDQHPDGSINFKKGHTKGVVLGDSDGGLWLVHSVPHFPPMDAGRYYYPHSGLEYGQSFLCVSLDIKNLNKVGTQLLYNKPSIFASDMPNNLRSQLPNLANIINNDVIKSAPWYHLEMLKSRAGSIFLSFAKSEKFAKELYADWIAPTLNISLLVETWPNGPGRLPSVCSRYYNVYNIETVSITAANCTFKTTTDHSKWAVVSSDNLISKWVCIGDINRAKSQKNRGGGTVCFISKSIAEVYEHSISKIEDCQHYMSK